MHPEIRKFWEDAGYTVYVGDPLTNIYEIHIGDAHWFYRIEIIAHGDNYRFDGEWYSEEEALRIVRMKVFL